MILTINIIITITVLVPVSIKSIEGGKIEGFDGEWGAGGGAKNNIRGWLKDQEPSNKHNRKNFFPCISFRDTPTLYNASKIE